MNRDFLPPTGERVERVSPRAANEEIRDETEETVADLAGAGRPAIDRRLRELDREWDIERALTLGAGVNVLLGLAMGALVNRRWFAWSGIVGAFLIQHSLHGWCPPIPILRRLHVRTAREIETERNALRILRGDFTATGEPARAVRQAREDERS